MLGNALINALLLTLSCWRSPVNAVRSANLSGCSFGDRLALFKGVWWFLKEKKSDRENNCSPKKFFGERSFPFFRGFLSFKATVMAIRRLGAEWVRTKRYYDLLLTACLHDQLKVQVIHTAVFQSDSSWSVHTDNCSFRSAKICTRHTHTIVHVT